MIFMPEEDNKEAKVEAQPSSLSEAQAEAAAAHAEYEAAKEAAEQAKPDDGTLRPTTISDAVAASEAAAEAEVAYKAAEGKLKAARVASEAAWKAEYESAKELVVEVKTGDSFSNKRKQDRIFRREMGEPEFFLFDKRVTMKSILSSEEQEEISRIIKGDVSLEVVSTDYEGMMEEGRRLRKYGDNVIVKCPMTGEGLKACKSLTAEGIPVNITLVFSPNQALLAAKAGAKYVSPFIGRLDDIGHTGMDLIKEIKQIFGNYDFKTEILVASIRHPQHVVDAGKIGADVVTVPAVVLGKMLNHTLTDKGLKAFLDDWEKLKSENPSVEV